MKQQPKEKRIQWHPACYAALNLEFAENKLDLEFQQEISLNELPLRIDALIIKKRQNCIIQNEIGKLFRKYNIVEYKSPEDSLNFNTFLKGIAYVYLYKTGDKNTENAKLQEITLTFIRERTPHKLFKQLTTDNFIIEEKYKGIYYISKDGYMPIQVVVSKKLDEKNHMWLNSLTKRLNKRKVEDLLMLTNKLVESDEKAYADSIWEIITRANRKLMEEMREDENMCKAMAEIFKPEIDAAFNNGFSDGFNDCRLQVFKNMIKRGISREDAQNIVEISDEQADRILAEI